MEEEDFLFDVRDKLRRTTPRSTYSNFMRNAHAGRYDVAAQYLDLYGMTAQTREAHTPEEARAFSEDHSGSFVCPHARTLKRTKRFDE